MIDEMIKDYNEVTRSLSSHFKNTVKVNKRYIVIKPIVYFKLGEPAKVSFYTRKANNNLYISSSIKPGKSSYYSIMRTRLNKVLKNENQTLKQLLDSRAVSIPSVRVRIPRALDLLPREYEIDFIYGDLIQIKGVII